MLASINAGQHWSTSVARKGNENKGKNQCRGQKKVLERHTPEVVGSNPAPATDEEGPVPVGAGPSVCAVIVQP